MPKYVHWSSPEEREGKRKEKTHKKTHKQTHNRPSKWQDTRSSSAANDLPNPEREEKTLHSPCTQDTTNIQGSGIEERR